MRLIYECRPIAFKLHPIWDDFISALRINKWYRCTGCPICAEIQFGTFQTLLLPAEDDLLTFSSKNVEPFEWTPGQWMSRAICSSDSLQHRPKWPVWPSSWKWRLICGHQDGRINHLVNRWHRSSSDLCHKLLCVVNVIRSMHVQT